MNQCDVKKLSCPSSNSNSNSNNSSSTNNNAADMAMVMKSSLSTVLQESTRCGHPLCYHDNKTQNEDNSREHKAPVTKDINKRSIYDLTLDDLLLNDHVDIYIKPPCCENSKMSLTVKTSAVVADINDTLVNSVGLTSSSSSVTTSEQRRSRKINSKKKSRSTTTTTTTTGRSRSPQLRQSGGSRL